MSNRCILPFIVFVALGAAAGAAAADVRVPDDYDTIQEAIDALASDTALGNRVIIEAGTYAEDLTLIDNLQLIGEETARVLLRSPNNTDTVITGENVSNVAIRNVTFIGGDTAISLTNANNVSILNNVFQLGDDNIAVDIRDDSTVDVVHNTFYDTGTALRRAGSLAVIENNIFAGNQIAIETASSDNIDYNLFHANDATDTVGGHDISGEDPLFAAILSRDFHLKEDSPAIDAGIGTDALDNTVADLGVYGGTYADTRPFPPQSVAAEDASDDEGSSAIDITWLPNLSYFVNHSSDADGGYRVYYDNAASGDPYDGRGASEGDSPIDVGNTTSLRLRGLAAANVVPDAPVITAIEPGPNSLAIHWNAVPNATRYDLYYGIGDVTEHPVELGTDTSHTLRGLVNGTTYRVAVRAYNQPIYYITVTAYDRFDGDEQHESDYSVEQVVPLGDLSESELSATVTAIPEVPVPSPNLPNEGCFIATAAYGYYDAREVRVLRRFRDEVLLHTAWGRDFVHWYYMHSPAAAQVIRDVPWLKSAVRVALWPAIHILDFENNPRSNIASVPLYMALCIGALFILAHTRRRRSPGVA